MYKHPNFSYKMLPLYSIVYGIYILVKSANCVTYMRVYYLGQPHVVYLQKYIKQVYKMMMKKPDVEQILIFSSNIQSHNNLY